MSISSFRTAELFGDGTASVIRLPEVKGVQIQSDNKNFSTYLELNLSPYLLSFIFGDKIWKDKLIKLVKCKTLSFEVDVAILTFEDKLFTDEGIEKVKGYVITALEQLYSDLTELHETFDDDKYEMTRKYLDHHLSPLDKDVKAFLVEYTKRLMIVCTKEKEGIIREHLKTVKEQDITTGTMKISGREMAIVRANMHRKDTLSVEIEIQPDSINITGFDEDVTSFHCKIRKFFNLYHHDSEELKLSTQLYGEENIKQLFKEKKISHENVTCFIESNRIHVVSRRQAKVKEVLSTIQNAMDCFEKTIDEKMLKSSNWEKFKKQLELEYGERFVISEDESFTVKFESTSEIINSIKEKLSSLEIVSEEIKFPDIFQCKFVLGTMKNRLEFKLAEECVELHQSNEENVIEVIGTMRGIERVRTKTSNIQVEVISLLNPKFRDFLNQRVGEFRLDCHFVTYVQKEVTIRVKNGNLESEKVDVIVNSIGANLELKGQDGTITNSLNMAAGIKVQGELSAKGSLEPGGIAVTGPGKINVKSIFHVYIPSYSKIKEKDCKMYLANAVRKCLILASEKRFKTIAFPPLSTGVMNYPSKMAADVIFEAIITFIQNNPKSSIEMVEVVLLASDKEKDKIFRAAVSSREQQLRDMPENIASDPLPWLPDYRCLLVSKAKHIDWAYQHLQEELQEQTIRKEI